MPQSVFVNAENKAVFTCPQCTRSRTADVSKFLGRENKPHLKVKCHCGHIFEAILERRRYYRKKTLLYGFASSDETGKHFPITVVNLSRSGVEFKTSESRSLQLGERLLAEFMLDDANKSLIRKKIEIKRIENGFVGAEFCFQDEYDKVLGFYFFR